MAVTESGHRASSEVDDLYRRHGGEIYRYALAVLGNHADAEDVTQTTFLNAYRSLEQGVRPRKPANWLLTIASNTLKQRFRQEQTRPRHVEFDDRTTEASTDDDEGPSVGELLVALSKIPPQQRQAIVLREFEGRSYAEIAEILGVTTTALETLLFRARRSLAEELEQQLTCTEAQLAISQATDGRLGRKQRRRLRDHVSECPDCARFTSLQQRNRRALKGLMLVPIPAGGVAVKAAAVVAAAAITGGVAVVGSTETGPKPPGKPPAQIDKPGARLGQVAPRGVLVPGNGVARGKAAAPGQLKRADAKAKARAHAAAVARKRGSAGRSAEAKAKAPGQTKRATEHRVATPGHTKPPREKPNPAEKKATAADTSSPPLSSVTPPPDPVPNGSSPSKSGQAKGHANGAKAG